MSRSKKIDHAQIMQTALDEQVEIIKQCEHEVVTKWKVMAMAVKEIHANRLWEANYQSFEHCMSTAVGWKKSWAYEMLKAADVLADAPITDASMARYLHALAPEQRMIAWEGAVTEAAPEKPTREHVKKSAALLKGGKDGEDGEDGDGEKKSGAPDEQEPPSIVPDSSEFDRIVAMLREARNAIEALSEKPAGSFITPAQIVVDLKNVFNALSWAKPHCVCVYCEGEGCKHCQSRGWLCKGLYASAPEDMKS